MQVVRVDPRENIRDGDLLVWTSETSSPMSRFFLRIIRLFTVSEYAHVSIAMNLHGKMGTIEATVPEVRAVRLQEDEDFYVIPMGVTMTEEAKEFLFSKLGVEYGFSDAIRAWLGMAINNKNRYQCAELCHEFYSLLGIELGKRLTPSSLVKNALRHSTNGMIYIPKVENPIEDEDLG